MTESFDFKSRYASILRYVVFAVIVMGVMLGVGTIWQSLSAQTKLLACEKKCRDMGAALTNYRTNNKNSLPVWLTQLSPAYFDAEGFVCPADPSKGKNGCFPKWIADDPEFPPELLYANLDGPSWDPAESEDNIPCSYYYRFNDYPSDVGDRQAPTWREIADAQVDNYRNDVPVVQCFWHLDEGTADDEGKVPSLVYDLIKVEFYPKKWLTRFKK